MYKKIKNYTSLLSQMKKNSNWHFNPIKKSKDAKYLGKIMLTKSIVDNAMSSVNRSKLKSAVSIFKSDISNYKNSEIAWSKMDNIQAGYNESNTLFKQVVFMNDKKMPIWCKKLIKLSKLENAYLAVNMNPPGTINPWHYDTYAGLLKRNKDNKFKLKDAIRILIFIQPWHWGHFLQVGNQIITHWDIGDVYTWDYQRYHLASNSGIKPRYTIAITGFTKNILKFN
tara:strand:+ start:214 stop:891 length:678 start_codon:yes stop_codon:yes gene_type:complete